MIISLSVALAVAAPEKGAGLFAPLLHKLPSRAEARSAVRQCGLPTKSVSVQYEPTMQEDIVRVARISGPLTEQKLTCIAQASLKTIYYVYFRDQVTQKRYDLLYWKLEYAADVVNARKWLRARNLLAGLPLPEKGQPLSYYAEAVEAYCGVKKGSLLVARDEHSITYAEGGLGQLTSRGVEHAAANEAQFECVMAATSAADLKSHNVFFGFIRNAAENNR